MKLTVTLFLLVLGLSSSFAAPTKKPATTVPAQKQTNSAPTKPTPSIAQIEGAVRAGIPGWLKAHPMATDQTGKPATLGKLTIEKTVPVSGWENIWSTSGKIKLSSGREQRFEARTEVGKTGAIKLVDVSLGF